MIPDVEFINFKKAKDKFLGLLTKYKEMTGG